ncbi:MAG: hypothetical protein IMY72_09210 [Bacteroidetes bacterium]|nr:hypothetical protein [Bacteroidota bacterium]
MKNHSNIIKTTIIIILLTLINSCTVNEKVFDEGVLEYKIEYLTNKKETPIVNLLPPSMYIKFKNNSTYTFIKGWMGVFSLSYISNSENETNTTLLKIMDKEYYYSSNFRDTNFVFDDLEGMNLQFTDDTKEILGYNCKKVIVTFQDEDKPPFEVYYTNEIKIKNLTLNTPFKNIDGVLMEFNIEMQKIPMRLTINKVKPAKVSDDVFYVPSSYIKVEKKRIQNILDSLI